MDEEKDGCVECMRYGFIMTNTLFLVLGILLVFLGVWFYAVPANQNLATITLEPEEQNEFKVAILLVIAVGVCVGLLAIISCFGGYADSKCLLVMVFLFTMTLMVLDLVLVAFAVVYHQQLEDGIPEQMAKTLSRDYAGDYSKNMESVAWREVQKKFQCCGVNTTEGYKNHTQMVYKNMTGSLWYRTIGNSSDQEWPHSCCHDSYSSQDQNITCYSTDDTSNAYLNRPGCASDVTKFIQLHLLYIAFTAGILVIFQTIMLVMVCKLCKIMPKKRVKSKVDDQRNVYDELFLEDYKR